MIERMDANHRWLASEDAGTHFPNQEGWRADLALVEKKVTQIFKSQHIGDRTGDLVVGR